MAPWKYLDNFFFSKVVWKEILFKKGETTETQPKKDGTMLLNLKLSTSPNEENCSTSQWDSEQNAHCPYSQE